MKYYKKIVYPALIFFLNWNSISGQTVLPPGRMEVYLQQSGNDTVRVFGDTVFSSQAIVLGTVHIKLQDTLNLAKIRVKLGTTPGGDDLFTKDFLFDVSGNFSDGTSYARNGLNVLLGVGQFIGLNTYYSEVQLEDTSQNLSPPVYYNEN